MEARLKRTVRSVENVVVFGEDLFCNYAAMREVHMVDRRGKAMSLTMQLNFNGKKASWRFFARDYKKATRRKARRQGKTMLEDAPKRATKGWAD